jgi:hypothetical protein
MFSFNIISFAELNNIWLIFWNVTSNADGVLVYVSINVCSPHQNIWSAFFFRVGVGRRFTLTYINCRNMDIILSIFCIVKFDSYWKLLYYNRDYVREYDIRVLYTGPPVWSSCQSSWLQIGDELCFLWGTNWIYVCYIEESRPPLWSSG